MGGGGVSISVSQDIFIPCSADTDSLCDRETDIPQDSDTDTQETPTTPPPHRHLLAYFTGKVNFFYWTLYTYIQVFGGGGGGEKAPLSPLDVSVPTVTS